MRCPARIKSSVAARASSFHDFVSRKQILTRSPVNRQLAITGKSHPRMLAWRATPLTAGRPGKAVCWPRTYALLRRRGLGDHTALPPPRHGEATCGSCPSPVATPFWRNRISAESSADTNTAMVLTAHLSLTGVMTESGLSGSTAWHNGCARMHFKSASDDDTTPVLGLKKNNYGPVSKSSAALARRRLGRSTRRRGCPIPLQRRFQRVPTPSIGVCTHTRQDFDPR